ncbi:MAG: IgGFc-binding protein [Labilithrix sp.]|nr:IgGFc-binding protein [Labilithrix sp.]
MRLRATGLAVCLGAVAAAPFGCGSDRDPYRRGIEETSFADAAAGNGCVGLERRCSRDLRAVVDGCDESLVVAVCPPDQGCAAGVCVPACSAAVSSAATMGCEFAALAPSRYDESRGSCFGALLTNTWGAPARIEAEYAGSAIDLAVSARVVRTSGDGVTYEPFTGEIQPGEIAVLFLNHMPERPVGPSPTGVGWVPCPADVTPAVVVDASIKGTARGQSFRIKTSAPVSAYSIYQLGKPGGHAATATLLLPVPAWKTGYIVTDAWEGDVGFPATQIVAAEDDTEVTILSSADILPGPDVEGAAKGAPKSYRMKRGEVLQFAQREQLDGSRIEATKSVAVLGGHECMNIPTGKRWCDQAQLQLFPVQSWGREYAAAPYLSRRDRGEPEPYLYRIVAAVDGTVLTYDPRRPPDAPTALDAAASRTFMTNEPFVVSAQDSEHPITVYAYMTGVEFGKAKMDDGDPEFTYVIPTDQFLDRYVFYVAPSYRNSHLVVVRARSEGKDFEPVTLDCAGPLVGWEPLGTGGKYELVRVRLGDGGACGPGRHEMTSPGPFSVTVWGTDVASSYAYPGGAALRPLNAVGGLVR